MLPIFCSASKRFQKGIVYTSKISDQVLDTNGETIKRTQCESAVLGGLFRNIWGSAVLPTTYHEKRTGLLVLFIVEIVNFEVGDLQM